MQAKSGGSRKRDGGKKLSARDKGKREGRREHVMAEREVVQEETFGREPKLFGHELHANKKMVFGSLDTSIIVLESMFEVKAVKKREEAGAAK